MEKNYYQSVVAIAVALFLNVCISSCGGDEREDPEPTAPPASSLSVAPSELSLAANAGAISSFTIASTSDWNISCSESWITLSPQKGTGASAVVVTASTENPKDTERKATITVRSGNETKYVTVTQAAPDILTLSGLDAPFDATAGSIQEAQELVITCNAAWTIEGKPEWLDISALSGTGKSTVKVWTNSSNSSTTARTATLIVKSGTKSSSKNVSQRAGFDANLQVSPKTIVTLSTGFAFDLTFGSSVKYYYVAKYLPTLLDRKTDEEIIAEMSADDSNRDTPNDNYINAWQNQNPLTEYIVCTVGYDQNGNHGSLTKTSIKTKSGSNQATAFISDVTYDDTYWKWTTTVNAYVTKYYMWFITNTNLYSSTDATVAWFFKDAMNKSPEDFAPIVQGDNWRVARNGGTRFHVATWAVDVNGNFSGVIENFYGSINSARKKGIKANYLEDTNPSRRFKTYK